MRACLCLLMAATVNPAPRRLLVLTDISSLTAGVREPDDGQSLIRLLLFSNEIEIEGLVASSNMRHGQVVRPELMREAIQAYARVRSNLLLHDRRYPPAERLSSLVKAGQPRAGLVGPEHDTEGSEWIIRAGDRTDSRPLWIAIWGGSTDLAQALDKVRRTRPPARVARFLAKLRVHAVGDQDKTGPWNREQFPTLYYIKRELAIRGMYRYGETSLTGPEWVEEHVRNGHGALGALYPNYDGGDIWTRTLGRVRGVKEGDTPSFLNLIDNGLSVLDGWGGRIVPDAVNPKHFRDEPVEPAWMSVLRWREAYQAEFQARLDWCVKPYREANHPPEARVRESQRAGRVIFDASSSRDPDGDRLTFEWSLDGEVRSGPSVEAGEKAPNRLLLTVRDTGFPPLSRYVVRPRERRR